MQNKMCVYLAHLHSALIIFDASWSSSLNSSVLQNKSNLSLLQVAVFTGTWKYNQKEEPYRTRQRCLFSVWQWPYLHLSREREKVLGTVCRPYCTEVILLRVVLLIFMIILFYPQSTHCVTVLRDVVSWVSMFIFNVFYCSLQLGILKVTDCLSHATA